MKPIETGARLSDMHQQEPIAHRQSPLIVTNEASDAVRRDARRLQRTVWVEPAAELAPVDLIRAAVQRAGSGAVVAGTSAALLHGARFIDPVGDIELIRDLNGSGRKYDSVRILRTDQLEPASIQIVDGLPVTTPIRTAYDLGRRRPEWRALARLDDLTHTTELDRAELWRYIRGHPRTSGIRQIRELINYIDPLAESARESQLRLLILKSSLPRPESQVEVKAPSGRVVARIDLAYRRHKIGIEYDGVDFHTSPEQRMSDAERDRELYELDWEMIHVTAEKMADPAAVIARIAEALAIRDYRIRE